MKKMVLLFVVLLVFITYPTISLAYYSDGNTLLKDCIESIKGFETAGDYNHFQSGACIGYISASFDMYEFITISAEHPPSICMEQNKIKTSQLVRITVKYLKEHPEKLNNSAAYLFWKVLSEAFPCTESQPSN